MDKNKKTKGKCFEIPVYLTQLCTYIKIYLCIIYLYIIFVTGHFDSLGAIYSAKLLRALSLL